MDLEAKHYGVSSLERRGTFVEASRAISDPKGTVCPRSLPHLWHWKEASLEACLMTCLEEVCSKEGPAQPEQEDKIEENWG